MNNQNIGKLGESHAEKFLIAQNYQIITRNYHSRFGEIDLIALETDGKSQSSAPQPSRLIFVEVKTRTSDLFGLPQESISPQKIKKILKTAIHFKNHSTEKLPHIWRIDAIAVKLNKDLQLISIEHFKNISDGN